MKCIVYGTNDSEMINICYPQIDKNAKNIVLMDSEDLPDSKYFRDAWEIDPKTKKVIINKEKAVKIKIQKIMQEFGFTANLMSLERAKKQAEMLSKLEKVKEIEKDLADMKNYFDKIQKKLMSIDDIGELANYNPISNQVSEEQ